MLVIVEVDFNIRMELLKFSFLTHRPTLTRADPDPRKCIESAYITVHYTTSRCFRYESEYEIIRSYSIILKYHIINNDIIKILEFCLCMYFFVFFPPKL